MGGFVGGAISFLILSLAVALGIVIARRFGGARAA